MRDDVLVHFQVMVKEQASDLILRTGHCPVARVEGSIRYLSEEVFTEEQADHLMSAILSEDDIAKLTVNLHNMPGVSIEATLVRSYPFKQALAHTIGYVGRINERELKSVNKNNYSATEHIGKTGIERYYENELHGLVGYQTVETNARGKIMEEKDTRHLA